MKKISTLLCVGLVAAFFVQRGESIDVQSLVTKNINNIKDKLNSLESTVKDSIAQLKNKLNSLTTTAIAKVETTIAQAETQLAPLKPDCKKTAQGDLGIVKDNFIMDLLNCQRNQDMITDVEKMVYSGRNLMDSFVSSAEELIKGFESCITINPFKAGICVTEEAFKTGKTIIVETALATEFTVTVTESTANLVQVAVWCIKNANENANKRIQEALQHAKNCNNK